MQRAWLIPLFVAAATVTLIVSTRPSAIDGFAARDPLGGQSDAIRDVRARHGARHGATIDAGTELLVDLDAYIDPEFGFTVAIPAGWTAVVAAESDAELEMLEPGYAVGFESPRERTGDVFADYLMIEILPGDDHGLFETDGTRRRTTRVNGRPAWRDALMLPADPADPDAVDLVVRQAAMPGLGYTVGLYAVGEPARLALLEDAFEAMLRTFRLTRAPFAVS